MYAGHVAAALALRGRERSIRVATFMLASFVLDLLWIAFDLLGLDRTPLDDWSHSLVAAIAWAAAFAALFGKREYGATVALWLAVFSHFVLDLLVQGASLFPYSGLHLPPLVSSFARRVQLGLCIILLLFFLNDERRAHAVTWRTWATCVIVLILNARFALPAM